MSTLNHSTLEPNSSKTTNGSVATPPHALTSESAAFLIQYALDNIDYPATPDDHRAIQLGAMAASYMLTGRPDASTFDPAELEQALARLSALSNRPEPAPEPAPEPPAPDSPIRYPTPTPDDLTGLSGYDIMALALNGLQDHLDGCMAFGEAVPTDLADNHPLRHKLAVLLDEAISRTDSVSASGASYDTLL